jgi:selenide,water dikinase
METIRLTQFSHGGGCGCKMAPGLLARLLHTPALNIPLPQDLLVGLDTSDDAAVYRLNAQQAVVATTDFFMPIVDDPHDFGRIAATNALSDLYAMGARPLFALALVGMPVDRLPEEAIAAILSGGQAACASAGIVIAGGHSIDAPEPIYGLVALGVVHPDQVKRNCDARAGDQLILSKPLGVGVYSAALKKEKLDSAGYAQMLHWTCALNGTGTTLGSWPGVHAMTDVTGFGLGGHLLEMCRGAQLGAQIHINALPLLPQARALIESGCVTGASARNWASYGAEIDGLADDWRRTILTDPQTSGGLLIACAPECSADVLSALHADGFTSSAVIGQMVSGEVQVCV